MVCHVTVVRYETISLVTGFLLLVTIFRHPNLHEDNDFHLRNNASRPCRQCDRNKIIFFGDDGTVLGNETTKVLYHISQVYYVNCLLTPLPWSVM